jgi:hypothetical protein
MMAEQIGRIVYTLSASFFNMPEIIQADILQDIVADATAQYEAAVKRLYAGLVKDGASEE